MILKKFKLILEDDKVSYLFPDEIISITPSKDQKGNAIMTVVYYDDDLCCSTSSLICNSILVEDLY